jgi:hypothetical protein
LNSSIKAKTCKNLQLLGDLPYQYDKIYWSGAAQCTVRTEFMKIKNDRIYSRDLRSINNSHLSQADVHRLNLREEQSKYRYILEIPSGQGEKEAGSSRVKFILHSKRLLFFVDRLLYDWVTCKMKPFVHYVPVKDDFSDLFEKIEWADTHQSEVEQIIKNAFELAPTKNDAIDHIKLLLFD